MLCTNIENLVSLWDLITLEFIYGQKKCIKESFIINTKTNNYAQQFLRLDTESTTIMIVSHLEDPGSMKTEITSANILSHIPRYLEPPVIVEYQLQYLPSIQVSSNLCIIAQGNNLSAQVQSLENIDLFSEVE